jgi:hypothetical protein
VSDEYHEEPCPACGETEILTDLGKGPLCRDCGLEALADSLRCDECHRVMGNGFGKAFGLDHERSCSRWRPPTEKEVRDAAMLGVELRPDGSRVAVAEEYLSTTACSSTREPDVEEKS